MRTYEEFSDERGTFRPNPELPARTAQRFPYHPMRFFS
jgi:hypothetical protein